MYCYLQVPRLQGQLTVDDFEKDRKAEIDRVRQMLQEVDDEHKSEKGILDKLLNHIQFFYVK